MCEELNLEELVQRYKLSEQFLEREVAERDLNEIALRIESWELLAKHLNLEESQIEPIRRSKVDYEVQKVMVLHTWKKKIAFKATHRVLLNVFLKIHWADLACKVCDILTSHEKIVTDLVDSRLYSAPTSNATPGRILNHGTSANVHKNNLVVQMEQEFREVVYQVEESFVEENVPLARLKSHSCHLPVDLKGHFGAVFEDKMSQFFRTESIPELLGKLSYFWDYSHPHLLSHLVGRFGSSQLRDVMLTYETKLKEFRKKVKITEYIGERRVNLDDKDMIHIKATFGDDWYQKTLADVEEMRCRFANKFFLLKLLPKMNGIVQNSIAIIFSIPKHVSLDHEQLCEFFLQYDALKVMVGSLCIYDSRSQEMVKDIPEAVEDQNDKIPVDADKPLLHNVLKGQEDRPQFAMLPVTHETKTEMLINQEPKSFVEIRSNLQIKPIDFFWDQLLRFIGYVLLLLAGILFLPLFIWDSNEVLCYLLPASTSLDHNPSELFSQMNEKHNPRCVRDDCTIGATTTSSIPDILSDIEYYLVFILLHGLVLLGSQLTWNTVYKSQQISFFRIAKMIDPLPNPQTGEYDDKNFEFVKKLQREYGNDWLFRTYVTKLTIQLTTCIASILVNLLWFSRNSLSIVIKHPVDFTLTQDERQPLQVVLINTLLPFRVGYYSHLILSIIAMSLTLYGIAWCFVRHTRELGYIDTARLCFQACLDLDSVTFSTFPSAITWSKLKSQRQMNLSWVLSLFPRVNIHNSVHPRIKCDLDFLLLVLFQASSSHGIVFKTIQIHDELRRLVSHEHQLLHLYINTQSDMNALGHATQHIEDTQVEVQNFHDIYLDRTLLKRNSERVVYNYFKPYLGSTSTIHLEEYGGIREQIYWYVAMFGPNDKQSADQTLGSSLRTRNELAVDLSFGSMGFSLVTAKPFKRVLSLKFSKLFRGCKSGDHFEVAIMRQYYTNYSTLTLPSDVFTQNNLKINEVFSKIASYITTTGAKIDFLLVGPITDEQQKVSLNLLLNMLHTCSWITEDALLLTVRPLKVCERTVTRYFHQYEPSKQLFSNAIEERVKSKLNEDNVLLEKVEEFEGVPIWCGKVPCVFEFSAYQFVGAYNTVDSEATNVSDKNQSESPPKEAADNEKQYNTVS